MTLTTVQKKDLLSEHFLLKHIPVNDLKKLAEASGTRMYPAESIIFSKGEIGIFTLDNSF